MDLVTAAQLMPVLTPLMDGALEGIGGQAWEALTRLVHAKRHQRPQLEATMNNAIERPADKTAVISFAAALEATARVDSEFARQLAEWYDSADNGSNININTGTATNLVQTKNFYGGFHVGSASPSDPPV